MPDHADLGTVALAAAGSEMGRRLTPAGSALRGSDRSVVLRAFVNGGPETVIVKAFDPARAGEGWVREAAALTTVRGSGARAVDLVAVLDRPPLVVLADLGGGPTLADRLLGSDPQLASGALGRWAEAMGSVHAASAGGRQAFEAALAHFAGDLPADPDTTGDALSESADRLADLLPRLGVDVPAAAIRELRDVESLLSTDVTALSPADACPDNAVTSGDGLVLLDFEGATWRHVAWDAAYLVVPWPSCWCSWRLPQDVASAALGRWRSVVAPVLPAVASEAFEADLALAASAWVWISTAWFLPRALDGDPSTAEPALAGLVPSRRAMIQHRLAGVVDRAAPGIAALNRLAETALDATRDAWGDVPLDLAPAFRP